MQVTEAVFSGFAGLEAYLAAHPDRALVRLWLAPDAARALAAAAIPAADRALLSATIVVQQNPYLPPGVVCARLVTRADVEAVAEAAARLLDSVAGDPAEERR